MDAERRVSVITPVYRSQRWLPTYFAALAAIEVTNGSLEVILVDNDPKAMPLEEYIAMAGSLELKVLSMDGNAGFAAACNRGARAASGDLLLFLNVDTEIDSQALQLLRDRLEHEPGCAIAEARHVPCAHPKFAWPGTGRVDWCSACCMLMRRDLFLECGGFDELFFMYGEDVDLSFRLRDRGYRLAYVPAATVVHHDSEKTTEQVIERTYHMVRSGLLLRARYSTSWHLAVGFWLELSRTLLRRRGRGFSRALAAIRDAFFVCPWLLVERWASVRPRIIRLFQDQGGFTLHWRFPLVAGRDELGESLPDFSVVVATENRDFLVEPLAEALLRQMDELGAGELVVVDHGPLVGAADGLAERFRQHERFVLVDHPEGSAADGRNAGIRRARGDIVIFVDDSTIPNEGFLARHLAAQGQYDVVQGPVHKPWPVAGSPFRKYVRDLRGARRRELAAAAVELAEKSGQGEQGGQGGQGGQFGQGEMTEMNWDELCAENLSVKAAVLEETVKTAGYFDRQLWSAEAADCELAWRLHRHGVKMAVDEQLLSLSREQPRFTAFLAEQFKAGYAAVQVEADTLEVAETLGGTAGTAGELARRLATHLFVVTPLAIPAFLLDLILPPRLKLNPIASWWFHSLAGLCRVAGRLWCRSFGHKSG